MSFTLSKLLWILCSPDNLLIVFLGIGLSLGVSTRESLRRKGRTLCLSVVVFMAALAILPIGSWALTPLENKYIFNPPQKVDGVILLGGDEQPETSEIRGQPTAYESMSRYVRFADMAQRYPQARLIFSGGSGLLHPRGHMKDDEVAADSLNSIGMPADKVYFENTSKNTYENAIYTASLIQPKPEQNWLLVTSAWHMPRAISCFRKAGWNVYASPAGYQTTGFYQSHPNFEFTRQLRLLSVAVHEYVGLISYYLMERIDAPWPE